MHGRRHQGTIRPGGGEPVEVTLIAHASAGNEIGAGIGGGGSPRSMASSLRVS